MLFFQQLFIFFSFFVQSLHAGSGGGSGGYGGGNGCRFCGDDDDRRLEENDIADHCFDVTYTIFGFVEGQHLGLFVSNQQDNNLHHDACSPMIFHSLKNSDGYLEKYKEVIFNGNEGDFFSSAELYDFGVEKKLFDINEAFENSSDGTVEGPYSLATNNCGGFIIEMMNNLDIEIDEEALNFLAKNIIDVEGLSEAMNEVFEEDSNNVSSLRGNSVDVENLKKFIKVYISNHDVGRNKK